MFNGTQLTMPVVPAYATSGGNDGGNNGAWGDGWVIWLFFILAIVWGGFGNGYGGFGGNGGGANAPAFQGWATRADIQESFATNNLQSGINAIQQGICDATYALDNTINNGFHNQTVATLQGFNGVQAGQSAIQSQLASCCCDLGRSIERGFADTNYNLATQICAVNNNMANNTRDIIDAQREGTREILTFLTNSKIEELQTELTQAQAQLSTANQTNNILNALRPCPIPSYQVPNPFAYCNPCGCGC